MIPPPFPPDQGGVPFPVPVKPGQQAAFLGLKVVIVEFGCGQQQRYGALADGRRNTGQLVRPGGEPVPDLGIQPAATTHPYAGVVRVRAAKLASFGDTPLGLRNRSRSGRTVWIGKLFSRALSCWTSGILSPGQLRAKARAGG